MGATTGSVGKSLCESSVELEAGTWRQRLCSAGLVLGLLMVVVFLWCLPQSSSPAEHGQLSACLEDSNCVTSETAALLLTLPSLLWPILRALQEQWSALPYRWTGLAVGDVSSKHDTLQNEAEKAAFSYTKCSFLSYLFHLFLFNTTGKKKSCMST